MDKKVRKEPKPNKLWRKVGNGVLLFGAGLMTGSRVELYLQQKGVTPTQCEIMSVDETTMQIAKDIGKKK